MCIRACKQKKRSACGHLFSRKQLLGVPIHIKNAITINTYGLIYFIGIGIEQGPIYTYINIFFTNTSKSQQIDEIHDSHMDL